MYCRNCGKQLSPLAEICMGCGVRLPKGDQFCNSCGAEVSPLAEMCVKCGAKLGKTTSRRKSKIASVLLAVFLGFWTWLYTYGKDGWKFWVGLVVDSAATALMFYGMIQPYGEVGIWLGVTVAIQFAVWVWPVVDAARRPGEWYDKYPNG